MSAVSFWDERYAQPGFLFGEAPKAFLKSQAARLAPGMRALAVADGEGRNGVWLAERGLGTSEKVLHEPRCSQILLSGAKRRAGRIR